MSEQLAELTWKEVAALRREFAALRGDLQRLTTHLVESKTPRQVRTAARYKLICQAGEILGPDRWRSAGKLAKLLNGPDVAFGELGKIVERILSYGEGARGQRRLFDIMKGAY